MSSPLFHLLTARTHHIFSGPYTESYTIGACGSQAFGLRMKYRLTSGSPSCIQQSMGLLSLYNHVNKLLTINLQYIYTFNSFLIFPVFFKENVSDSKGQVLHN